MYITKKALEELLHVAAQKEAEQCLLVRENTGPGNYDAWAPLEYDDPYQRLEYQSQTTHKKKIIISHPIPVDEKNLAFIDALVSTYDVYLWPGIDESFAKCKPIMGTADFFERQSKIVADSKKTVQAELSKQQIAANDYLILDYLHFQGIKIS